MKLYLVMLFALIALPGCASLSSVPDNETMIIQHIIDVPGQSKTKIFEKSKMWIAQNFKSAKAVIEYENKEEGVIIGNASITRPASLANITGGGLVRFNVKEEIKDEKARLTFEKFILAVPVTYNTPAGGGGEFPVSLQADWNGTKDVIKKLTEDLRIYLLKTDISNNW